MSTAYEVNFDGIVGPTHNYAGLSVGNVASQKHAGQAAHPKKAALEGLDKMRSVAALGIRQAVLPPQSRPDLDLLRRVGFTGPDPQVIERAGREDPVLLACAYSASSMWTANAATISPSADTQDGRVHITPANLENKLHRSIEPPTTARALYAIFNDKNHFIHHAALPSCDTLGDEGAANHGRFCKDHGDPGVELFVYGRSALNSSITAPERYPARQTIEASRAVARLHGLVPSRVVFAHQNPAVIDRGVFHNDVISVANQDVFLVHEDAFADLDDVLSRIDQAYRTANSDPSVRAVIVRRDRVSVENAVATYLFNSQLLTLPSGAMTLVAPTECRDHEGVRAHLDELTSADTNPIDQVIYLDVRESMKNGGGPACLRLRVVLTSEELHAANPGVMMTDVLHGKLVNWIEQRYRDELRADDLRDPKLVDEVRIALDELTQILEIGSIYPFQLP